MGKVTTVSATALPCARRGDVRSGFEIWPKQMGNGKFLGKPECWWGGGYTVMDQILTRGE